MKENNKKNGLVSFFEEFPMINATALARYIGINDTLMRQYKKGDTYISDEKLEKIRQALRDLGEKIANYDFKS